MFFFLSLIFLSVAYTSFESLENYISMDACYLIIQHKDRRLEIIREAKCFTDRSVSLIRHLVNNRMAKMREKEREEAVM
jgi:hypothetical protein